MHDLQWKTDTEFSVGPLNFKCLMGNYHATKTSREHVVILKPRHMIERGINLYRNNGVKRAFEFGIFQGGSVLLLTQALGLDLMAALDFSDPIPALDALIEEHCLQDRLRLSYKVSQRDRPAMERVLAASFDPGDLDLIVDDASHLYDLTKNSFEVAFPWLRPGGLYVIEDWGWAHWGGYWQSSGARWQDRPAMSNLIFELTMATATSPKLIQQTTILESMVIVRKSPKAPVGQLLVLDEHYSLRGKTLNKI